MLTNELEVPVAEESDPLANYHEDQSRLSMHTMWAEVGSLLLVDLLTNSALPDSPSTVNPPGLTLWARLKRGQEIEDWCNSKDKERLSLEERGSWETACRCDHCCKWRLGDMKWSRCKHLRMLIWSSFEGSYKGLLAIGLDGSSKLRRLDLMSREGDRRTLAGRTVSAYSQPFTQQRQRQRQIDKERERGRETGFVLCLALVYCFEFLGKWQHSGRGSDEEREYDLNCRLCNNLSFLSLPVLLWRCTLARKEKKRKDQPFFCASLLLWLKMEACNLRKIQRLVFNFLCVCV